MSKEMTNAQFDALLEMLAKLVEKAKTVEEAAKIIRESKTKQ